MIISKKYIKVNRSNQSPMKSMKTRVQTCENNKSTFVTYPAIFSQGISTQLSNKQIYLLLLLRRYSILFSVFKCFCLVLWFILWFNLKLRDYTEFIEVIWIEIPNSNTMNYLLAKFHSFVCLFSNSTTELFNL